MFASILKRFTQHATMAPNHPIPVRQLAYPTELNGFENIPVRISMHWQMHCDDGNNKRRRKIKKNKENVINRIISRFYFGFVAAGSIWTFIESNLRNLQWIYQSFTMHIFHVIVISILLFIFFESKWVGTCAHSQAYNVWIAFGSIWFPWFYAHIVFDDELSVYNRCKSIYEW